MYKLVAIDVDGTLLNSNHELPTRNKYILDILLEKNVYIVLATGKSYFIAQKLILDLGLKTPQITNDGALIIDPVTGKVLMKYHLPVSLAKKVISLTRSLNVTTLVVNEAAIFSEQQNDDIQYMRSYGEPEPTFVENLNKVLDLGATHIMIITYKNDELYEKTYKSLQMMFGNQANIFKSSPYFIEILAPQASKGNALAFLMKYLGVNSSEAVCIGDGLNDLSMFSVVNFSVAMGNAHIQLKKLATLVTDTHDNLGFAKALEKLFCLTEKPILTSPIVLKGNIK
jgi:Cof subfamily protein (haloacid dehalogenase superfamily)